MKNARIIRSALWALTILGTTALFLMLSTKSGAEYVSTGHSISERVVDIPYEKALVDYCAVLSQVNGVTGVSYRGYDVITKTAIVTVYYDPGRTTDQQIRTYLGNTRSIWDDPLQV